MDGLKDISQIHLVVVDELQEMNKAKQQTQKTFVDTHWHAAAKEPWRLKDPLLNSVDSVPSLISELPSHLVTKGMKEISLPKAYSILAPLKSLPTSYLVKKVPLSFCRHNCYRKNRNCWPIERRLNELNMDNKYVDQKLNSYWLLTAPFKKQIYKATRLLLTTGTCTGPLTFPTYLWLNSSDYSFRFTATSSDLLQVAEMNIILSPRKGLSTPFWKGTAHLLLAALTSQYNDYTKPMCTVSWCLAPNSNVSTSQKFCKGNTRGGNEVRNYFHTALWFKSRLHTSYQQCW